MKKVLFGFVLFLLLVPSLASATDWYVRPTGGDYGSEDGTSYVNAWDGFENVIWGGAGIVAGDTLYVCGLHLRTYSVAPNAIIVTPVSGSSGNVITLRGDYSGDPGEIWGGAIVQHEAWTHVGDNTYSITLPKNINSAFVFEDVTIDGHTLLDKEDSLEACQANAGSYYSSDYQYNSELYVHCSDDAAPTGRIVIGRTGYQFELDDLSYITFQSLELYYIYQWLDATTTPPESVDHFTWKDCTIWYGDGPVMLFFRDTSHHLLFDGCDIAWATNGIGFAEKVHGGGSETHDWTITGCTFHDIGVRVTSTDAHAISVQGTRNSLIEKSEFYNCGTTICYYCPANASIKNATIRWNYVHDTHMLGGANGRGIALNLGVSTSEDEKSDIKVYGNIVARADVGIRSQWGYEPVEIYNNVVYGCNTSYKVDHYNDVAKARLKNLISLNPAIFHIDFRAGVSEGEYLIDSDYNLLYPVSGNQFSFDDGDQSRQEMTFSEWQSLSKSGCTFDPHSLTVDPLFVYPDNDDFRLQSNSPAIDNGTDVGLTLDYEGNPIPSGNGADIGAYEYQSACTPACSQNSDCGSDPCKTYTCNNPGTCSASCSSQNITSCVNDDGCCPPGCTYQNDNDCVGVVPGDLNNDGYVNIIDLTFICIHFGETVSHQNWNATADVISDNEIDIFDLVYVASRFTSSNISVTCNPSSGGTDTIVTIPISIDGNQQEITAFGIYNFTYDTSMFSYQNVTRGILTANWFAVDGNEIFPGNVISGGFAGAAEPIPIGSSGSIEVFSLIVTCSGCSSGQQSQICIFNYIDHIEGMIPEPFCTTFTFT